MSDTEVTMIIQTLERVSDKLDKHDDKFDSIADTLKQLVKIDTEQRELRLSMDRAFKRIEHLEHVHTEQGCNKCREIDARHIRELEKAHKDHDNYDKRIKALEDKPKDRMEVIVKAFLGALGVGLYTYLLTKFK